MNFGNTTSEDRFYQRISRFASRSTPVWMHHFWWMTHNCVAHPIIGVVPLVSERGGDLAFRFHDFTSRKINLEE